MSFIIIYYHTYDYPNLTLPSHYQLHITITPVLYKSFPDPIKHPPRHHLRRIIHKPLEHLCAQRGRNRTNNEADAISGDVRKMPLVSQGEEEFNANGVNYCCLHKEITCKEKGRGVSFNFSGANWKDKTTREEQGIDSLNDLRPNHRKTGFPITDCNHD